MPKQLKIEGKAAIQENLGEGFLKSLHRFPDLPALFINEQLFTYSQLFRKAQTIAHAFGTSKHKRIAIYCVDDVFSYAAILAVSLYGACYIPLNSRFPAERNLEYLKSSGATLLIAQSDSSINFEFPGDVDFLNKFPETKIPEDLLLKPVIDQELSYILFTSGSTGAPKGVPVSKKNTSYFFNYFLKEYDFTESDGFLQPYELTFDVSVFSIFLSWHVGACCYVVPSSGIRFMNILNTLRNFPVTVCTMVPGVLRYLEKYLNQLQLAAIRYSFFSGDALEEELALKWSDALPNAAIHNFYGPTETTIVCTRYAWNKNDLANNAIVPLGKPFPEMEALIVDDENKSVAGERGELCFSGAQVIDHYLENKNEESFFEFKNKRWYKTGDLVSYNESGNLIFHGRKDHQVKINGFRVELGEVEAELKKICGDCAVVCEKDNSGNNTLIAFITKQIDNVNSIISQLSAKLPAYMIPKRYEFIDSLPLNLNGKTDRQKLIKLVHGH